MSSRYYAVNPEAEDQSISSFPNLEGATSTLSNVGGNADAKLALEDALALDARKRKLLASFGLRAPTGVLLFGPPGTGKTMLAREVAMSLRNQSNKSKCNTIGSFISLKASEIVRPEVGNSEKLIVSAFRMARANAPSVVFIDEFQALFGDRGGSSVVLGQLASTLLQCMDDLQKWSEIATTSDDNSHNGRIVVLAATNTPWMVDKAFLRPGRFDRAVHVGLPNLCDREDILRVHTKTMKIEPSEVDDLCKSMAKLCIGFSGADLASLCKAAAVRCLHNGEEKTGIRKGHFVDAFENDVVRSSSDELVKRISSWTA
jgi:SpoVK/Ycf46/Vps4 family AAA+-type ATPase